MALPNPIPDNPLRWDGWKKYNSPNFYDRLCIDFESNPSAENIEGNCRLLLVWWQKKLPLKNQPSNPMAQLLRSGLDEAPLCLAEARTALLDAEQRLKIDAELRALIIKAALEEFKKIIQFVVVDKKLTPDGEGRLFESGKSHGLSEEDIKAVIDSEIERLGAVRADPPPPPPPVAVVSAPAAAHAPVGDTVSRDPFDEFRRMLKLSRLCLDGDEMTDDQRDALCNMGESLGLTGGQAEDLIDEYLEEMSGMPVSPAPNSPPRAVTAVAVKPVQKPVAPQRAAGNVSKEPVINTSPIARAQEKLKYPNFSNTLGCEMLLIPSGMFVMGSAATDASPQEQPLTQATLGCFYMARFPVTNAQYERFDPEHRAKRAQWADDRHPVVYVNSREAERFCQWLSQQEGRKYRLPTEAEWEYAARGLEGRVFPWGDALDEGHYANFADANTPFAWRDPGINDGFAETSPVGSYRRGASPFGIEDMAGNVFEWCLDFFDAYKGKEKVSPRGPSSGPRRIYRGGSWRSKSGSLRATARHYNTPEYSSNDVGFRILCEVE